MIESFPEEDWSAVLAMVSEVIDLEESARSTGALLRRRQIQSAEDLLRLALVYGPGGQSLRDTAAWAALEGVADMSKTALLYRLRDAAPWMGQITAALLARRSAEAGETTATRLGRHIRLVDGSSITSLGTAKDWRLHAVYDLEHQRFDTLELTDKSQGEALERMVAGPGDLVIADRGYARLKGLRHIAGSGGDFLVRLGSKSVRLRHADGRPLELAAVLAASKAQGSADLDVTMVDTNRADPADLPARLVVLPKPDHAAQSSRAKALRASQKGGHKNDPLSLASAEHLILITSMPRREASPEQLASAYRLRWQIELAFKRLKTLLHIDRLPAVDPNLARTWLLAHLITVLLLEDLTPHLRDSPP